MSALTCQYSLVSIHKPLTNTLVFARYYPYLRICISDIVCLGWQVTDWQKSMIGIRCAMSAGKPFQVKFRPGLPGPSSVIYPRSMCMGLQMNIRSFYMFLSAAIAKFLALFEAARIQKPITKLLCCFDRPPHQKPLNSYDLRKWKNDWITTPLSDSNHLNDYYQRINV